jgi:hypothetical protein
MVSSHGQRADVGSLPTVVLTSERTLTIPMYPAVRRATTAEVRA